MADRSEFQRTVYQMRDDLNELKTALLGTDENRELGFIERTNATLREHDTRIDSVEQWKWKVVGGGGVIAFIGAWLGKKFGL